MLTLSYPDYDDELEYPETELDTQGPYAPSALPEPLETDESLPVLSSGMRSDTYEDTAAELEELPVMQRQPELPVVDALLTPRVASREDQELSEVRTKIDQLTRYNFMAANQPYPTSRGPLRMGEGVG